MASMAMSCLGLIHTYVSVRIYIYMYIYIYIYIVLSVIRMPRVKDMLKTVSGAAKIRPPQVG